MQAAVCSRSTGGEGRPEPRQCAGVGVKNGGYGGSRWEQNQGDVVGQGILKRRV